MCPGVVRPPLGRGVADHGVVLLDPGLAALGSAEFPARRDVEPEVLTVVIEATPTGESSAADRSVAFGMQPIESVEVGEFRRRDGGEVDDHPTSLT